MAFLTAHNCFVIFGIGLLILAMIYEIDNRLNGRSRWLVFLIPNFLGIIITTALALDSPVETIPNLVRETSSLNLKNLEKYQNAIDTIGHPTGKLTDFRPSEFDDDGNKVALHWKRKAD